jgi:hypothetical protein
LKKIIAENPVTAIKPTKTKNPIIFRSSIFEYTHNQYLISNKAIIAYIYIVTPPICGDSIGADKKMKNKFGKIFFMKITLNAFCFNNK